MIFKKIQSHQKSQKVRKKSKSQRKSQKVKEKVKKSNENSKSHRKSQKVTEKLWGKKSHVRKILSKLPLDYDLEFCHFPIS